MEIARQNEHDARLKDVEEKFLRRDQEGKSVDSDVIDTENQNRHLRSKEDILLQERDALQKYMDELMRVNNEIQVELDTFV